MKFSEFLNTFAASPIIDAGTFRLYTPRAADLRRQVHGWVEKGYLLPLKRGIYVLSPEWRRTQPSVLFIANFLHAPSYISLEYAMAFHGLIPEKATVLTSATTRKTQTYRNALGVFEYRSVKKELFWGYAAHGDLGQQFLIAEPEKALLDFFHLNSDYRGAAGEFESLRLENLEGIDTEKLIGYAAKFNRRVRGVAATLAAWARDEKARLERL
jgi:predicted transcriptional regulator of viral defense system